MSIQYTAPGFEPTTFKRESPPITTRPGLFYSRHSTHDLTSARRETFRSNVKLLGRGGGLLVRMHVIYSKGPSSNPIEVSLQFLCKLY